MLSMKISVGSKKVQWPIVIGLFSVLEVRRSSPSKVEGAKTNTPSKSNTYKRLPVV
jgi:hypothetical protein